MRRVGRAWRWPERVVDPVLDERHEGEAGGQRHFAGPHDGLKGRGAIRRAGQDGKA